MPIYLWKGVILRRFGKIAVGPACCCNGDGCAGCPDAPASVRVTICENTDQECTFLNVEEILGQHTLYFVPGDSGPELCVYSRIFDPVVNVMDIYWIREIRFEFVDGVVSTIEILGNYYPSEDPSEDDMIVWAGYESDGALVCADMNSAGQGTGDPIEFELVTGECTAGFPADVSYLGEAECD